MSRLAAAACVAVVLPAAAWTAGPAGRSAEGGTAGGRTYLDGPPPGHAGGFGEPTCHRCHFDRPVGPEGGGVAVEGLPDVYGAGDSYRIEVRVRGEEMDRAGFQLAVRCADGEHRGEQAGRLTATGPRVEVVEGTGEPYRGAAGVEYARHALSGSGLTAPGRATWSVRWEAPPAGGRGRGATAAACGVAAVHVAANAANGDDSEFGDRIYVDSFRVRRSDERDVPGSGRPHPETGARTRADGGERTAG